MSLSLNPNKASQLTDGSQVEVDTKSNPEKKDASSSSSSANTSEITTPGKHSQQKMPVIVPKLKTSDLSPMKAPVSPRELKSPKRQPEQKKPSPEKKEEFADIEGIKINFAEEWSAQTEQISNSGPDVKKNEDASCSVSTLIKPYESPVKVDDAFAYSNISGPFVIQRATISLRSPRSVYKNSSVDDNQNESSKTSSISTISSSSSTSSTSSAFFIQNKSIESEKSSQALGLAETSHLSLVMDELLDILVREANSQPITSKTVSHVGRLDCALLILRLPEILMPYVENKSDKYVKSEKLIQAFFSREIKSGNVWKEFEKIYAEILKSDSLKKYVVGENDPRIMATAKSMIKPFSDRIAEVFFGSQKLVQTFPLSKEIIQFLLKADHLFFKKLMNSNFTSKLTMDDIDKARFSFLSNLLVTRLLQPLIMSKISTPPTQLEMWFQSSILNALQEAIVTFSEDFFELSFSNAPEDLKSAALKKIKEEEIATLERAKARFSELRMNSSRRHVRAISEGVKTSDAMEEISKYKFREKTLKDKMNKMKEVYSMKHLPESLLRLIDSGYKEFMVSHQEINDSQIVDYLKQIAINFRKSEVSVEDTSMEMVDEFIEKLKKSEDHEIHNNAVRRATRVTKNFDQGFLKKVFSANVAEPTTTASTISSTHNTTSTSSSSTATSNSIVSSAAVQSTSPLQASDLNASGKSDDSIEITKEKGE